MSDRYGVEYREEVERDLAALDRPTRRRVMDAVESRLAVSPESYGRPLGGSLAGLRRIRIGDYRVGYQIRAKVVVVWAVQHRRGVYAALLKRWTA